MYSYEISADPVMSTIFYNGVAVDVVGPWDLESSAVQWADLYVNSKNAGL